MTFGNMYEEDVEIFVYIISTQKTPSSLNRQLIIVQGTWSFLFL